MRRNFLKSSLFTLTTINFWPVRLFNSKTFDQVTLFHINSDRSFWKNETHRETLLNIVSQNPSATIPVDWPSLTITINQDDSLHMSLYQKIAQRLNRANLNHNVIYLSNEEFWDNWTSYEFTLLDWDTAGRSRAEIASLMIDPQSHLCLQNAHSLCSNASAHPSKDPFRHLVAVI